MAEELLHSSKVRAGVEQVRGERMPQRVGMRRRERAAVEDPARVARREPLAARVAEHRVVGRLDREQGAERVGGGGRDRHLPLLTPLAPDGHRAAPEIDVAGAEPADLADPEPAAVQELEEGVVASSDLRGVVVDAGGRLVEERRQLVGLQDAGQPALPRRRRETGGGVGGDRTGAGQPAEVAPQR